MHVVPFTLRWLHVQRAEFSHAFGPQQMLIDIIRIASIQLMATCVCTSTWTEQSMFSDGIESDAFICGRSCHTLIAP